MLTKLGLLKKSVIFIMIGSREVYCIRFIGGKIFSTRSYKTTYSTEADSLKVFFRDYLSGKEGIPICIIYDLPNQVFTEYRFLKSISKKAVHNAITKKIANDIPQGGVHDYQKIHNYGSKQNEDVYQVVSLIDTPIISICTDLLKKFPNPIAGYFSMLLEMSVVCEGSSKKIQLPIARPIIEKDVLDIKESNVDDVNIAIQHSPISGINFTMYQGTRILFSHNIICGKIDEEVDSDIISTVNTILDHCTQMNAGYNVYVYGSEFLLTKILKTNIDKNFIYYTQPELADSKFFYHKQYSTNFTKANVLDSIAFHCLYEPILFIENKAFFTAIYKHFFIRFFLVLCAFVIIFLFIYELYASSMSFMTFLVKRYNGDSININNITHHIEDLEKDVQTKRKVVDFYSQFSHTPYHNFLLSLKNIIKDTSFIKNLSYHCEKNCYGENPQMNVTISGVVSDEQDYYNIVSDLTRVYYNYTVTRKIEATTGEFSIHMEMENKS